jgi:type III pantothenate kinase
MGEHWDVAPEFLRSQKLAWGVVNSYADPETLGVDRWLTLVAVQARQLSPACILDCGTAITLDLIDGEGAHRGGLILPGLRLMRKAILDSTSIQAEEVVPPSGLLAHDTAGAIALGGIQAVVSLVKRVLDESEIELRARPRLLLTGGDSGYLKAHFDELWELESDLVLSGLAVIAVGKNL